MSNHVGSQVGALSYPVSPRRGDSTLIRVRNLRLYFRAHACEGGHMQAPIYTNLSPHPHTYARGTCKFSSHSNVLVVFLRRNPDFCTLGSSTPLDVPLTGVARRISLLFCVCLGHRVM